MGRHIQSAAAVGRKEKELEGKSRKNKRKTKQKSLEDTRVEDIGKGAAWTERKRTIKQ